MTKDFVSLLPKNMGVFVRALEECSHKRLQSLENPIAKLWNFETCPSEFLPYLAEALACEIWDSDWPEEKKRKTLSVWLQIRAKRGTRFAVKEALMQLGVTAEIVEWWQKQDSQQKTKTFDVYFWFDANTPKKLENTEYLGAIVDSLKPVAAHGSYVGVGTRVTAKEILVGAISTVDVLRFSAEMSK